MKIILQLGHTEKRKSPLWSEKVLQTVKVSYLYYKYALKYLETRHNFLLALFRYCKKDNSSLAVKMH